MARPQKTGLDYFPLDVDFFNDDKITFLEYKHGSDGPVILLRLLGELYRVGYCYRFGEVEQVAFAAKTRKTVEQVKSIINTALEIGAFSASVFNETGLLTSKGIQRRFFEACARRARLKIYRNVLLIDQSELPSNVEVVGDYLLLDIKVKERKVKIATDCIHDVAETPQSVALMQHHVAETQQQSVANQRSIAPKKFKYAERILIPEEQAQKIISELCDNDSNFFKTQCEEASDWLLSKGQTRKDSAAFMRNWIKRSKAYQSRSNRFNKSEPNPFGNFTGDEI